ncbi:MAG: hypothetical protein ACRCTD_14345 [Beijerinckiaceae bacterium]
MMTRHILGAIALVCACAGSVAAQSPEKFKSISGIFGFLGSAPMNESTEPENPSFFNFLLH